MEEIKIETVDNTVEGVKKESEIDIITKPDNTGQKEKMEVDTVEAKPGIKDELSSLKPLNIIVKKESEDAVYIQVEGIDCDGDDEEELVTMTVSEVRKFVTQKICEYVTDEKVNPVLAVRGRARDLLEDIKDRVEEIAKVGRALDVVYKNQEKFLRSVNIFPKIPTHNVSVSVNLPLLMDSAPLMSRAQPADEDAVIRKDLSDARVMSPSFSRKKPTPVTLNSTPTVPKGISITPVPNTTAAVSTNTTSSAPVVTKTPISSLTTTVKNLPKLAPKPTGNIVCIDLTDDVPPAVPKPVTNPSPLAAISLVKHPAPLPPKPFSPPNSSLPNTPPKPRLKISSEDRGIVLQWDMPPNNPPFTVYSKLKAFDIFGYQEQKNTVINTLLWKKIGSVSAMKLPMACTLTQFVEGQKYHFAIRAVDEHDRCGSYSEAISIVYKPNYALKL